LTTPTPSTTSLLSLPDALPTSNNELDDKEIEVEVKAQPQMPRFEMPGMPGASVGVMNISDLLGKAFGGQTKTKRTTVKDSYDILIAEESDNLLDEDKIIEEATQLVENAGIVFLDEIDKICAREGRVG